MSIPTPGGAFEEVPLSTRRASPDEAPGHGRSGTPSLPLPVSSSSGESTPKGSGGSPIRTVERRLAWSRAGSPLLRRGVAAQVLIVLLCLAAWWAGDRLRTSMSVTIDEPTHVRAAHELRSGLGVVSNFEHPVLMRVLAAAGLRPADPVSTTGTVRDARRLFPAVFAALVLVAGLWARGRAGPATGVFSAAVLFVEPSFRAFACIVHTDVLVTLFLVSAAAALDRGTRGHGVSFEWLLASGILYGGALVSKYSSLPFLVIFAAVAVVRVAAKSKRSPRTIDGRLSGLPRAGLLVATSVVVPALLTLGFVQQAVVRATPRSDLRDAIRKSVEDEVLQQMTPRGHFVLSVTERLPAGLAAYATGLEFVERAGRPGSRVNYLFGEVSGSGYFWYFPVALGLKLTTATVVFAAFSFVATVVWSVRALSTGRTRRLRALGDRAFIPLTLGFAYLAASMQTSVNIGVRHVMPAAVFLLLGFVLALRTLVPSRRKSLALLLGVALALSAVEAAAQSGREISFGNRFAGGHRGLRTKLSDSNVDWGAGQSRLFDRVRRRDLGRVAALTLVLDAEESRALGIENLAAPLTGGALCSYDAVFVSVWVWDSVNALMGSTEGNSYYAFLRRSYGPVLALRGCFDLVEEVGPEYLLFRRAASRDGRAGIAGSGPAGFEGTSPVPTGTPSKLPGAASRQPEARAGEGLETARDAPSPRTFHASSALAWNRRQATR